ncbi:MAG: hypothetical protein AAFV33_16415 [Chloroflexota bacterium]
MSDLDMEFGPVSSFNDNSETIVLVFYREEDAESWTTDTINFDRVPITGEYFAMSREGEWYQVKAVVHMGFPLDYDAEIYAVQVKDRGSLRQSFIDEL